MKIRDGVLLLLIVLMLIGCAARRPLMQTPNLYAAGQQELFTNISPELKTNRVDLFFVTDRSPEQDDNGNLIYGFGRSNSVAFGLATVEIGANVSWETLSDNSLRRQRSERLDLRMGTIVEHGRFPPTPLPFQTHGGFVTYDPAALAEVQAMETRARTELSRRLALTPRKEVLIYVHGYNNTFNDAAFTLAELWHFFGREAVPILYTWPAGYGGLRGYTYDRESSEFTVFHLKQLLKFLARYDDVEKVQVLAHSRGTGVITAALRELFLESRAAGIDPRERFKIENLVLAAPDLDFEVIQQRMMTNPISPGVGQLAVYVSQGDRAIGMAQWLFGGLKRVGRLEVTDLSDKEVAGVVRSVDNVHFVNLQGEGGAFGHGYFHDNPAVSSDLMLILRYNRKPGAENGRPLQNVQGQFWVIHDNYLLLP